MTEEQASPIRSFRFTIAGGTVAFLAVLALFVAVGFDRIFAFYSAVGLALLAVAAVAGRVNINGVLLTALAKAEVVAGEIVPLRVRLSALSKQRASRDLVVRIRFPRHRLRPAGYLPALPAGGTVVVPCQYRVLERGRYRRIELHVATTYPIGLFEFSVKHELPADALVFPRAARIRGIERLVARRVGAVNASRDLGAGSEVLRGFHEWRPGESYRYIHWKVSARRGRLMVREFEEDLKQPVHLLFWTARDRGSVPSPRSFEHAVRLAASLVEYFQRREHRLRFTVVGKNTQTIDAGRSRLGGSRALAILAEVEPLTLEAADPDPLAEVALSSDELNILVRSGGRVGPLDEDLDLVLDVDVAGTLRWLARSCGWSLNEGVPVP